MSMRRTPTKTSRAVEYAAVRAREKMLVGMGGLLCDLLFHDLERTEVLEGAPAWSHVRTNARVVYVANGSWWRIKPGRQCWKVVSGWTASRPTATPPSTARSLLSELSRGCRGCNGPKGAPSVWQRRLVTSRPKRWVGLRVRVRVSLYPWGA